LFSDLIRAIDLKTKPVAKILDKYKIGSEISVFYQNGLFTTNKSK
jgi:hypothetical protein